MSRASQEFFKHQIQKDDSIAETDVRISLTFRSVSWRNHNSTIILGDSNTGDLRFGTHGATFRASMPGVQKFAYHIDELDPLLCLGFNNIVIHTGLNDIRKPSIRTADDVRSLYIDFKTQVDRIAKINSRARIFISPILPCRIADVNRKALMFNKLIFNDLIQFNRNYSTIHGYDDFVNTSNGCLKEQYSKGDDLHLNIEAGVRLLATLIKKSIFYRKQSHRKQSSSMSYANARRSRPAGGPPRRS